MNEEHLVAEEPVVTYTVKDILARIEAKLDTVTGALTGRLDKVEADVGELKAEMQHRKDSREDMRWRVMAFASLAAALATVVTLLVHG